MTTDPIGYLPAVKEIASASPPAAGFGSWLTQELGRVNSDLVQANHAVQQLATGEAENLHHVMIALEEARIGVQLLVQVRNRLLEAYQDVMRMQV
jgi:flagellar hook-basal body complex protein FliE